MEPVLGLRKDDAVWTVDDVRIQEHKALRAKKRLLFEGAQGVLLDENYGFAPYTTSSYGLTAREKQWGSATPTAAMS